MKLSSIVKGKTAFLFDFDGVVTDSEPYAFQTLRTLVHEHYGIAIDDEDIAFTIGMDVCGTAAAVSRKYSISLSGDELVALLSAYPDYYTEYEGIRPFPYIPELFRKLKEDGKRIAIVSSTHSSHLEAALERMGAPRSFSITLAVTLRFLPALRQDLRHIRDAMALRNIRGFEEKLECIYVPMLMGAAQTAEELSESATARGIEYPGKMSSWRPIGFHIQDVVVTLLFLALCVGGICCKGVLP